MKGWAPPRDQKGICETFSTDIVAFAAFIRIQTRLLDTTKGQANVKKSRAVVWRGIYRILKYEQRFQDKSQTQIQIIEFGINMANENTRLVTSGDSLYDRWD